MKLPLRVLALLAVLAVGSSADARTLCRNATGTIGGWFYTFWHDTGTGCVTLGRAGAYSVDWRLDATGNLVAGKGWAVGSPARVIGYQARQFDPGSNGYLGLYGWSTDPLVEYYVVDSWGGFRPPGNAAVMLGTVESDGGTYRIFRTTRSNQPSIAGTATFHQYWSVRTAKRPIGGRNRITFAHHVAAWRRAGLRLGTLDYQVLATEGFGSTGHARVRVWEE